MNTSNFICINNNGKFVSLIEDAAHDLYIKEVSTAKEATVLNDALVSHDVKLRNALSAHPEGISKITINVSASKKAVTKAKAEQGNVFATGVFQKEYILDAEGKKVKGYPREGSKTRAAWELFDSLIEKDLTRLEIIEIGLKKGMKNGTLSAQYNDWCKYQAAKNR